MQSDIHGVYYKLIIMPDINVKLIIRIHNNETVVNQRRSCKMIASVFRLSVRISLEYQRCQYMGHEVNIDGVNDSS